MTPEQRAFHARYRHDQLSTGFDARALRLAGVTEELEAAEDALRQRDEDRVEGRSARRVSRHDARRRADCPSDLYARVFGA